MDISTEIILAALLLLPSTILIYYKRSFGYWNRRGVTTQPATFPFGNAKDVILQKITCGEDMKNLYFSMKPKELKFCGYYFLTTPTLVILDLKLIKEVLTKDFSHFTDHANYVNQKTDPLGAHLFFLKGLKWKNVRAKVTPTFTPGKMKMMFPILLKCADELLVLMDQMVENVETIDINKVVGSFTTDVIGSSAFGIELNSLKNPDSEFREHVKKIYEFSTVGMFKHYLAASFPSFFDFLDLPLTNPEITKYFMRVIKEIVTHREENNVIRNDFMHLLIQLKNNVKIKDEDTIGQLHENGFTFGESFTIEEIAAQAFSFFIAGLETSATTLSFCFYELVRNLDIQEKLKREIDEILEKHDQQITYDALMEMTYMDKCINETLRKYPSVTNLSRECTQTYQIPNSNLILNKGNQIFIPVLGIHYDAEYYPEPEKFDPERFSSANNSKRNPYTWLPFGEGPRACIGIRFGMMKMKMALAVLLKHYKFSLNSKTQLPLIMDPKSMTTKAKGGIWLNAKKELC